MKTYYASSLFLIAILSGCDDDTEIKSEAVPKITVSVPVPEPQPIQTAPVTPRTKWDVYMGRPTLGVEQAMLRAAVHWEQASVGGVKYQFHNASEEFKCVDDAIYFTSLPFSQMESGGEGNEYIAQHEVRNGDNWGCHYIYIVDPWPEDMKATWDMLYTRLGVNPLVMVAAHELGHVMGVPHTSPEVRSIMLPSINLLKVSRPTCLDISLLSNIIGTSMSCYEAP